MRAAGAGAVGSCFGHIDFIMDATYVRPMSGWTLITIEEFEANAEAIIDRAEAGERFNVSRNGVITMTVVPKTDQGDTNIQD